MRAPHAADGQWCRMNRAHINDPMVRKALADLSAVLGRMRCLEAKAITQIYEMSRVPVVGRVPNFINQSEEAHLTPLHSPVSQFKGGDCPSSSPADFQDIDASRDDYRAGISKGAL